MGEHLERFSEETYAQLRLDGKTHDEAMAIIDDAIKQAIPRAVNNFLSEVLSEQAEAAGDAGLGG